MAESKSYNSTAENEIGAGTETATETGTDLNHLNVSGLHGEDLSLIIDNVVSTDEYFKTSEPVLARKKQCHTCSF